MVLHRRDDFYSNNFGATLQKILIQSKFADRHSEGFDKAKFKGDLKALKDEKARWQEKNDEINSIIKAAEPMKVQVTHNESELDLGLDNHYFDIEIFNGKNKAVDIAGNELMPSEVRAGSWVLDENGFVAGEITKIYEKEQTKSLKDEVRKAAQKCVKNKNEDIER